MLFSKGFALSLLFFLALDNGGLVVVRAAEVNLVVLTPPTTSSTEGISEYFPLAPAVESVVRLAAEHLNVDESLLDGDEVTLSVVASLQATEAASGLCSAIKGNTTVAVSDR